MNSIEKELERQRLYRKKNKDAINALQRKKYNINKDLRKVSQKKWRDENKEARAAYYSKNREAIRKKEKERYAKNNPKKEKMITPMNFTVSDKHKICKHCKEEKPSTEFNGFNRICEPCKEKTKNRQKFAGMRDIKVGRKSTPIKFMDKKHSNNRINQANRNHEKIAVLPEKTVKVKLKIEDKLGRTNKVVGKNWDNQLAEIKLKIKSL